MGDENKEARGKLHDAWLNLVGMVSNAEHKMMESLGLNPDAPLGEELLGRIRKNREDFERRIDEGVKTAVARVRAPIDKELASLRTRVEKIQEAIDQKLERKRGK